VRHRLAGLPGLLALLIILAFVDQTLALGRLMRQEQTEELSARTPVSPVKGALVIQGGGDILPEIWERFVSLAGGSGANFVFIPTAEDPIDPRNPSQDEFPTKKFMHVTVLHTRCRTQADTEAFIAPLRSADGVWFGGGRQWRLVDSYLNTRVQRELQGVLERGGVIGGSSAGATVLGSYLVRGAIAGPDVMMAKGYEEGFGFLQNVAIDQHVDTRKRENDMSAVVAAHPELLGIGLEEPSAIVVSGDEFEVIGVGRVVITDGKEHDGKTYYYLKVGDRFNLKTRMKE
jgi:cyanophycinase